MMKTSSVLSVLYGALLLSMLSACSATPDMETARRAAAQQDYSTAMHHYTALSAFGMPEAKIEMGRMYMDGKGVPADPRKALTLFNEAAEAGDNRIAARQIPKAQRQLGAKAIRSEAPGVSTAEGVELLQKAAASGDANALYQLGYAHEKGLGVPVDAARAAAYYRDASQKGYHRAYVALGRLYEKGIGVPADHALAHGFYLKARENGITVDADLQRMQKKAG